MPNTRHGVSLETHKLVTSTERQGSCETKVKAIRRRYLESIIKNGLGPYQFSEGYIQTH